jgi:hypothetical protein
MPTNAQAALQAAATVYSGGRGHTTPAAVKILAESFKKWLDHQDATEQPEPEQRDTQLDAMVERAEPTAPPELHKDIREEPIYRAGQRVGF